MAWSLAFLNLIWVRGGKQGERGCKAARQALSCSRMSAWMQVQGMLCFASLSTTCHVWPLPAGQCHYTCARELRMGHQSKSTEKQSGHASMRRLWCNAGLFHAARGMQVKNVGHRLQLEQCLNVSPSLSEHRALMTNPPAAAYKHCA